MNIFRIEAVIMGLLMLTLYACGSTGKLKGRTLAKSKAVIAQLEDSLGGGHLGIYIEAMETGEVVAAYNEHKYFVPASNTKLLSLYAGLKYLPDSLPGLRYFDAGDTIFALPTGDPTLLENDFKLQPVVKWLQNLKKPLVIEAPNWKAERYGRGWTWSDYQASYQPERSALPVYGNRLPVMIKTRKVIADEKSEQLTMEVSMGPAGSNRFRLNPDGVRWEVSSGQRFSVVRAYNSNFFTVRYGGLKDTTINTRIPIVTNGIQLATSVLRQLTASERDSLNIIASANHSFFNKTDRAGFSTIYSQPLDSMLQVMMYRSDNLYAEQTLLMAANEKLGYMSDRDMIDSLLQTDLLAMPDKPVWADGSGLSRYNLQSPANWVWLLRKMKDEFGIDRLKGILPTGNTGTLNNFYKPLTSKLFAKTGTLSGVVALSGFMYANSGRLLFFSVQVNNHNTDSVKVRRMVERYLMKVWEEN